MNATRTLLLGCALLLGALVPQLGTAQNSLPVLPGHRVRLTVSHGKPVAHSDGGIVLASGQAIVGDWEANSEGTILLKDQSGLGSWRIPAESVERMEVSLGQERRMGRSVVQWVAGLGAGFGILGAMAWEPCEEVGFMACFMTPASRSEAFGMGAIGGAILGIPIGLIAGLRKHEIWRNESVQGLRASIQTAPGGRIGLGLTLPTGNRYSP